MANPPQADDAARLAARKRLIARWTAGLLLACGVAVGLLDAYASRAQTATQSPAEAQRRASGTTSASNVSAASAATGKSPALNTDVTTAIATAKPVNPAQQKAVRNPSQLNSQISPAATPVANNTTSSSDTSTSSTKPKPNMTATLKKALPPSAVDWAQAVVMSKRSQIRAQANSIAARLPKVELDKTLLPVLLPRAGATLKATEASMISFGTAYSLNLPQRPGLNIILYGHRTLTPADNGGVANLKRSKITGVAEDIFLSQTEDGWTASFKRYGVVYTVDVSCDDLEATECQDDGYIRKAITDLGEVSLGTEALKEAVTAGVKP